MPDRNLEVMVRELVSCFALDRFVRGLFSPLFVVCASLGYLGLLLPRRSFPDSPGALVWFVLAPFAEELTWRAIMQNELARLLPGKGPLTRANLITSLAFAAAHMLAAPKLMSLLTFFPSLCFGALWSQFRSLWLCCLLHLWYNAALLF